MGKPSTHPRGLEKGGIESFVRHVIRWWALLGGLVLSALCVMTVISVTLISTSGQQVPGDFEMTEIGVAVSAFMFLPYAQLTGANVTVDIFTSWASDRFVAVMNLFASLLAGAFALLLLWRMTQGMFDFYRYEEVTGIIGFPIWAAYPPMLASLAFLLLAAVLTCNEAWVKLRTSGPGRTGQSPSGH